MLTNEFLYFVEQKKMIVGKTVDGSHWLA